MYCSSSLFVPTAFQSISEKKHNRRDKKLGSQMIMSAFPCFRDNSVVYPMETVQHHSFFNQFSSSSFVNLSSCSSCSSSPSKLFPKPPTVFNPFCLSSDKDIDSNLFCYDEEYDDIKESDLSDLVRNQDECLQYMSTQIPFKIIDIPDKTAIILERKYGGERIHGVLDWDEKDVGWDDNKRNFCLALTVVKGDGPRLEILCTLTCDKFEIVVIDRLLINVPEREESFGQNLAYELDLDEDLLGAFRMYLEKRGIGKCFEGENWGCMRTKRDVYLKKMTEKESMTETK